MILHQIRLGRPADEPDITDLTTAVRTGPAAWFDCCEHGAADCLDMPLDPEPTETEALAIRRRLVTADADEEARLYQMVAARETASTPFERLWLDTELSRYGEQE